MPIPAEYASKCPACGEEIEEGDPIELSDEAGGWVHADCHEGDDG